MADRQLGLAHHAREHSQVTTGASNATASALEFAETNTISLEWRLSGLRATYESSKGETKSKCVKSAIFGDPDNLWEILWYPNSGASGGDHASLYLSCVPTQQERELAIGNKWVRKGMWWFRFEVKVPAPDDRNPNKMTVLASKDASDHTFAAKTGNWGWQQFAKRDALFLNPHVIASDSFIIVCTISSQPQPPAGYWLGLSVPSRTSTVLGSPNLVTWTGGDGASGGVAGGTMAAGGPKRVVPRELVNSVGELFDDPLYSDVEFVVVPSSRKAREQEAVLPKRRVYANKKLLSRCEYFEALFHGGFREVEGTIGEEDDDDDDIDVLSDSDQDDEVDDLLDAPLKRDRRMSTAPFRGQTTGDDLKTSVPHDPQHTSGDASANISDGEDHPVDELSDAESGEFPTDGGTKRLRSDSRAKTEPNHVRTEPIHGTTEPFDIPAASISASPAASAPASTTGSVPGPKKTKIVVRDAAWSTWYAVMYYLYTDTIYFAPLASSFMTDETASSTPERGPRQSKTSATGITEPRSRREWIATWLEERGHTSHSAAFDDAHPSDLGPRPVSAKAVYRLADRLDLPALRLRAYQHICSQLTAQNIPAEVFSRFSTTFEDVRKVQVGFFLKHWSEIKKSETMQNIWTQIRHGKHVGFEEVWPLILGQLDFRPDRS